jgi:hypothetical protein
MVYYLLVFDIVLLEYILYLTILECLFQVILHVLGTLLMPPPSNPRYP